MVLEHPFKDFMNDLGNKKGLITSNLIDETIVITDGSLQSTDCKHYNSLVVDLSESTGDFRFMGIEGRTADGTWKQLKMVSENLFLLPSITRETGRYYIDIVGIESIRLNRTTSAFKFKASITMSANYAPNPLDAAIRYKRIRPEDGDVEGYFRAIEPLTDITLSDRIRVVESEVGESSSDRAYIFNSGDVRLAGQPLYGPFDRVKIDDGVALLVLMDV